MAMQRHATYSVLRSLAATRLARLRRLHTRRRAVTWAGVPAVALVGYAVTAVGYPWRGMLFALGGLVPVLWQRTLNRLEAELIRTHCPRCENLFHVPDTFAKKPWRRWPEQCL